MLYHETFINQAEIWFLRHVSKIVSSSKMNCINKIITILVILSIQIQVSEQAKINTRLFGKALARWNPKFLLKPRTGQRPDKHWDLVVCGSLFDSLNSTLFSVWTMHSPIFNGMISMRRPSDQKSFTFSSMAIVSMTKLLSTSST